MIALLAYEFMLTEKNNLVDNGMWNVNYLCCEIRCQSLIIDTNWFKAPAQADCADIGIQVVDLYANYTTLWVQISTALLLCLTLLFSLLF